MNEKTLDFIIERTPQEKYEVWKHYATETLEPHINNLSLRVRSLMEDGQSKEIRHLREEISQLKIQLYLKTL